MSWSRNWPAPAKINRFLHINGRRADGYHCLQTVFQFVDWLDHLHFEVLSDPVVERLGELPGVPASTDLVVRAANSLRETAAYRGGVRIAIDKRLPMGGGLGGGSSDAATVLVALNRLWGLGLSEDELAALGLHLGADVPVFVRGVAAWAEGVGEVLEPCPQRESAIAIVTPDCAVSTAKVFTDPDLTRHTPAIKMHALSLARARNDCEPVTRRLYPEVGRALDWLSGFGATRMSGTGASVFALFDTFEQASRVVAQAPASWTAYAGRCINRSPLLDRLETPIADS